VYQVDGRDNVVKLKDVPQSSTGAPCPLVLAREGTLVLAYYIIDEVRAEALGGKTVGVVGPGSVDETVALVRFHICYASMFGPPNDEAFSGHPLYASGLKHYSANIVENSSWIRSLERMNSVHPRHNPESYKRRKHFIFAFHDSTFECVADGYEIHLRQGSLSSLVPQMQQLLAH
jgi:hypothetical protein